MQEVDQGLALILLKRHLDPQQEAGMHPFKMSDFVLIPDVWLRETLLCGARTPALQ